MDRKGVQNDLVKRQRSHLKIAEHIKNIPLSESVAM